MLRKLVLVPVLCVALVSTGFTGSVQAAVIGTQQAMSAEARLAAEASVRARRRARRACSRQRMAQCPRREGNGTGPAGAIAQSGGRRSP